MLTFVRERMTSWDLTKVDPLLQTFIQVHVLLRNWFVEVKPWAHLVRRNKNGFNGGSWRWRQRILSLHIRMRWKSNQGVSCETQELVLILRATESWDMHASVLEVWATKVVRLIRTGWSDLRRACSNLWPRHDTTTPQSTGICTASPHALEHSLLAALRLGT